MMRVVSVLAVIVFAGGCEQRMEVSGFGKVDEIPLLVRFENQCPKEVIETVANCAVPDSARDPNKPDEMPACRKQNEKIIWLAVTGASMPYQRDATPPEFEIVFKGGKYDPIEKSNGRECKASRNGVLDCKIKSGAPRDKWFDYSVVARSCTLDPRIYVP
jgi:hypothetical protein